MKPDAIIMADVHLRDTQPVARKDDFWKAQKKAIGFILELQRKHDNIPILDGGDFLDKWRSSPYLENWIIRNFPQNRNIYTIPGTHDTPNHNINYLNESSLSVLEAAGIIYILKDIHKPAFLDDAFLYGYPHGKLSDIKKENIEFPNNYKGRKVLILHTYACKHGTKWFAPDSKNSKAILRIAKDFDLIITGHNHESFVIKQNGRLLVNPGSLMRTTAKQIDHKPRVYLWYAEENEIEPIYLPIEEDVLSREHIETKKEEDERMSSFVSRLDDDYEVSLSFKKNMEKHLINNSTDKEIEEEIWNSIK